VDPKFVALRGYPAAVHAELAKSALEANGITAYVRGATQSHQRWSPGRSIELWVDERDVDVANRVLGPEERFSF
jgi:Putative prokaryotic signal transducing protein